MLTRSERFFSCLPACVARYSGRGFSSNLSKLDRSQRYVILLVVTVVVTLDSRLIEQ